MATGDLSGNIASLQRLLRHLKYPAVVDEEGLRAGDPCAALPVLHHILVGYSRHVAAHALACGAELQGKTDARFVEAALRLLRTGLGVRAALAPAQFLARGFAERKVLLLADAAAAARALHLDAVRRGREAARAAARRGGAIHGGGPAAASNAACSSGIGGGYDSGYDEMVAAAAAVEAAAFDPGSPLRPREPPPAPLAAAGRPARIYPPPAEAYDPSRFATGTSSGSDDDDDGSGGDDTDDGGDDAGGAPDAGGELSMRQLALHVARPSTRGSSRAPSPKPAQRHLQQRRQQQQQWQEPGRGLVSASQHRDQGGADTASCSTRPGLFSGSSTPPPSAAELSTVGDYFQAWRPGADAAGALALAPAPASTALAASTAADPAAAGASDGAKPGALVQLASAVANAAGSGGGGGGAGQLHALLAGVMARLQQATAELAQHREEARCAQDALQARVTVLEGRLRFLENRLEADGARAVGLASQPPRIGLVDSGGGGLDNAALPGAASGCHLQRGARLCGATRLLDELMAPALEDDGGGGGSEGGKVDRASWGVWPPTVLPAPCAAQPGAHLQHHLQHHQQQHQQYVPSLDSTPLQPPPPQQQWHVERPALWPPPPPALPFGPKAAAAARWGAPLAGSLAAAAAGARRELPRALGGVAAGTGVTGGGGLALTGGGHARGAPPPQALVAQLEARHAEARALLEGLRQERALRC